MAGTRSERYRKCTACGGPVEGGRHGVPGDVETVYCSAVCLVREAVARAGIDAR